ncbi:hypothetical protein EVAR_39022_1 [Eumeta japonica]|uniref:Uncharacterized protein n=1 Tax=Eumeta variegata TaxID=151549 RepID=A0A4C1WNA3_EUMVA|nr:hypothetical protein EVAR_39022_1 [Eumeta japonica]
MIDAETAAWIFKYNGEEQSARHAGSARRERGVSSETGPARGHSTETMSPEALEGNALRVSFFYTSLVSLNPF